MRRTYLNLATSSPSPAAAGTSTSTRRVADRVWPQPESDAMDSTLTLAETQNISDSFMTADGSGSGNTTQFFSVLEETDGTLNETILNDISHISLENEYDLDLHVENDTAKTPEPEVAAQQEQEQGGEVENDVVVFKTPICEKWYGLQVAQDEEGNFQKYQFELVQNDDGQFESVTGTIQQVPFETTPLSVAELEQEETDMEQEEIQMEQEETQIEQEETQIEQEQTHIEQDIDEDTDHKMALQENHTFLVKEEISEPELESEPEPVPEQKPELEDALQPEFKPEPEEILGDLSPDNLANFEENDDDEEHHDLMLEPQVLLEEEDSTHALDPMDQEDLGIYSPEVEFDPELEAQLDDGDEETSETIQIFINDDDSMEMQTEEPIGKFALGGALRRTIALYPMPAGTTLKRKTITTIDLPPTRPKLLNVAAGEALKPLKSLNKLKRTFGFPPSYQQMQQSAATLSPQKENQAVLRVSPSSHKKPTTYRKIRPFELAAAPAAHKVKEKDKATKHVASPWNVNRMLSQTTILVAPVRQARLPRKQKIEPLERVGEELVFQHVVVSSNGIGDGECVQISDTETDDERVRRKRDKLKTRTDAVEIVISDSEDENKASEKIAENTNDADGKIADETNEDEEKIAQVADVSEAEEKKTVNPRRSTRHLKAGSETHLNHLEKVANKCTKCSKSFPSLGSLKTHMHLHTFEEKKNEAKAPPATASAKHKCARCDEAFINQFLLRKHTQLHDAKVKNECAVCRRLFANQAQLNVHKRTHKSPASPSTRKSPRLTSQSQPSNLTSFVTSNQTSNFRRQTRSTSTSRISTLSKLSKPAALMKTKSSSSVPTTPAPSARFKCYTCSAGFATKMLLDTHVIRNCVKSPRRTQRSMLPNTTIASHTAIAASNTPAPVTRSLKASSMSALGSGGKELTASARRRGRIPVNAGIPIGGKMRNTFLNLKRKLEQPEDDDDHNADRK